MLKSAEWTEEELGRLRLLYSSDISFEEMLESFPNRTPHAIRLKASRLGLKRPTISQDSASTMLLCVEGNGRSKGYLLRCGDCGSWIHLRDSSSGRCGECGAPCQLIL